MVTEPNIDRRLCQSGDMASSTERANVGNEKVSLGTVKREFDRFDKIDIAESDSIRLLGGLFPGWLLESCTPESEKIFEDVLRFSKEDEQVVVGCFANDINNRNIISYKYRMKQNIKWYARPGTSPNGYIMYRVDAPNQNENRIYVVEGHHDMLTAILLGINFIMVPYAGYGIKEENPFLDISKGKELIFLVEDEPAFKCMYRIAKSIENEANKIFLHQLVKSEEKIDLTDYCYKKKSLSEVQDELNNI